MSSVIIHIPSYINLYDKQCFIVTNDTDMLRRLNPFFEHDSSPNRLQVALSANELIDKLLELNYDLIGFTASDSRLLWTLVKKSALPRRLSAIPVNLILPTPSRQTSVCDIADKQENMIKESSFEIEANKE